MKILMLNYEFPPIGGGGASANLSMLGELANNEELEIDVLTSGVLPQVSENRMGSNIAIYKVGIHKKNLHYWRRCEVLEWLAKASVHYRRLLRQNNYDLVHAFFGFPTAVLCLLSKGKIPYMISLRGSDVPGINRRLYFEYKILGPLFRRIWGNAEQLIAPSLGLRERALAFYPEADIKVISNGVNLRKFRPGQQSRNSDGFRLLTVGRLSASKRIELLTAAAKLVRQKYPDTKLTIAGGGKGDAQLKRDSSEQVIYCGRIPNHQIPSVYQQNDIFVSATAQEGMSNAMLEAMASGLPIITTRCEGVEELIGDNGIIVEKAEAESIADAILTVIENKELRIAMAQAGRKRAHLFSWSRVTEEYIQCYRQIIESKKEKRICAV